MVVGIRAFMATINRQRRQKTLHNKESTMKTGRRRQTDRRTDKQTVRKTNTQTDKQTGSQTGRLLYL